MVDTLKEYKSRTDGLKFKPTVQTDVTKHI